MRNNSNQQKNESRIQIVKMTPWKQAFITTAGVYPLLLGYEWLVKLLPIQPIDRRVSALVVVLMVAFTMVYIVMPVFIKLTGKWIFQAVSKKNQLNPNK